MKVYVKYNAKPPYLPVALGDTKRELAQLLGVTANTVYSAYSHKRSTYQVVEIEEDDEQ